MKPRHLRSVSSPEGVETTKLVFNRKRDIGLLLRVVGVHVYDLVDFKPLKDDEKLSRIGLLEAHGCTISTGENEGEIVTLPDKLPAEFMASGPDQEQLVLNALASFPVRSQSSPRLGDFIMSVRADRMYKQLTATPEA